MKSEQLREKVEKAEKFEKELEEIDDRIKFLIKITTPPTLSVQQPIRFFDSDFTISIGELRQIYEARKSSLEHELKAL